MLVGCWKIKFLWEFEYIASIPTTSVCIQSKRKRAKKKKKTGHSSTPVMAMVQFYAEITKGQGYGNLTPSGSEQVFARTVI